MSEGSRQGDITQSQATTPHEDEDTERPVICSAGTSECSDFIITKVALDGKPDWPYQEWRLEKVPRGSESHSHPTAEDTGKYEEGVCSIKEGNSHQKEQENNEDDEDSITYEPDHWTEEMSGTLSSHVPIVKMLNYLSPQLHVSTVLYEEVTKDMLGMMNSTAEAMKSLYGVFQRCYIMQVGSTTENTKIGKPDEFDFAVVLPYFFNDSDSMMSVLYGEDKEKLLNDPDFASIVEEFTVLTLDGDERTIMENLQSVLKHAWTNVMQDHIPVGWTLLENRCYAEYTSIAGTSHFARDKDDFVVDIDVCFWTTIHKSQLSKAGERLRQGDFILKYCLDDEQKIFAVLPVDYRIEYSLNSVRFAMSVQESKELNKYGENNGRIKSYKFAKCIAKFFLPKRQKHTGCDRCFNSLVPSYCLKNIVLYMARNHLDESMWVDEQVGNRLVEIFTILNFCMKVNCSMVSSFLTPYCVQLGIQAVQFNPEKREISDGSFHDQRQAQVCLPETDIVENCFPSNPVCAKLLNNYFEFIYEKDWNVPEVIDRLNEMLSGLREEDESERAEIANNPGCLCFQLIHTNVDGAVHILTSHRDD